jgi:hypothetical protein
VRSVGLRASQSLPSEKRKEARGLLVVALTNDTYPTSGAAAAAQAPRVTKSECCDGALSTPARQLFTVRSSVDAEGRVQVWCRVCCESGSSRIGQLFGAMCEASLRLRARRAAIKASRDDALAPAPRGPHLFWGFSLRPRNKAMDRPTSSNRYRHRQRAILCAAAAAAAAGALGLLLWRRGSRQSDRPQPPSDASGSPAESSPPAQDRRVDHVESDPGEVELHPAFAPIDTVDQLLREFGGDDGSDDSATVMAAAPPSPPPAPPFPLPRGVPRTADELALLNHRPPPLLICHDMMGGYLPYETATRGVPLPDSSSAAAAAAADPRSLAFVLPTEAFACADLFVYFSHRLVTIPPRCWISAAHRHGTPILGTLIVEQRSAADALLGVGDGDDDNDTGGGGGSGVAGLGGLILGAARAARRRWRAAAADDTPPPPPPPTQQERSPELVARALARLARQRGFDGYLLNVESPLSRGQARRALELTRHLRRELEATATTAANCGAFVVWYDACTIDGRLAWQDALTLRNAPFFDAAGLLFTNYRWKAREPNKSAAVARARGAAPFSSSSSSSVAAAAAAAAASTANPRRVLMGVDVYGRGAYGGGGDNTDVALSAARAAGVGAAIFAFGWTWEGGQNREAVERRGEHSELQRKWWARVRRAWWGAGGGGGGGVREGGGNGGGSDGGGSNGSSGSSWERVSCGSGGSSDGAGAGGQQQQQQPPAAFSFCKAPRPLAWRLPFSTNFNAGAWRRLHLSTGAPAAGAPSSSSSLLWGAAAAPGNLPPPHPGAARAWCDLSTQEPVPQGARAVGAAQEPAAASSSSSPLRSEPLALLDFSDGFDSGCCMRLSPSPTTTTTTSTTLLRLFSLAIDVPPSSASSGGAREVVVRAALRRAAAAAEPSSSSPGLQPPSARLAVVLWGKRLRRREGDEEEEEEESVIWTGPAWEAPAAQWQAREAVARLSVGDGWTGVVVTALGVALVAGGSAAARAADKKARADSASAAPALLLGHLSLRAPRAPVPPPAVCC